jgi:hypothetical protein
MSAAPVPTRLPEQAATLAKEVPALTDAYRKAHKSYVLVAGLLASWELIGITLNTKEKWGVELKSPAAVPLILFTLVFYSGYKMTIEWLQCDAERREHFAVKLDYWVAHSIGAVAVGISVVQYLWRVRATDVILGNHFGRIIIWTSSVWFVFISAFILITNWRMADRMKRWKLSLSVAIVVIGAAGAGLVVSKKSFVDFALGFGSGISLFALTIITAYLFVAYLLTAYLLKFISYLLTGLSKPSIKTDSGTRETPQG